MTQNAIPQVMPGLGLEPARANDPVTQAILLQVQSSEERLKAGFAHLCHQQASQLTVEYESPRGKKAPGVTILRNNIPVAAMSLTRALHYIENAPKKAPDG